MTDALAVIFCMLGLAFLWVAWRVFRSKHEPIVRREGVSWLDVLLDVVLQGIWIDGTAVDRFTAVAAYVVFGALFLGGGLYVGLH